MILRLMFLTLVGLLLGTGVALAEIRIGVIASSTGPAAGVGIPQKNTVALLPSEIGGQKIEYIVLDDASDPTSAVTNVRKLLAEHKVDALIGPTTTPAALAMPDSSHESTTRPRKMRELSCRIQPMDDKKRWVFKTTQNDDLIATALLANMTAAGIRTVGFIGFNDPYGENLHSYSGPIV